MRGLRRRIQKTYDEARTRYLEADGYLVARFRNGDAFAHLDRVLSTIAKEIRKKKYPQETVDRRFAACRPAGEDALRLSIGTGLRIVLVLILLGVI